MLQNAFPPAGWRIKNNAAAAAAAAASRPLADSGSAVAAKQLVTYIPQKSSVMTAQQSAEEKPVCPSVHQSVRTAAISRTEIKRGGVLVETPAKSAASAQFPSQIALFLNARHKHTRHQARRLMKVQRRERRARRAFISPRFSEFFFFFVHAPLHAARFYWTSLSFPKSSAFV